MNKPHRPTDCRVCEFAKHPQIIEPLGNYDPFEVFYDSSSQAMAYNGTRVSIDSNDAAVL